MNWLIVALGSAIGGVLRYWLSEVISEKTSQFFPWGTFVVNVTGCLLIGVVAALAQTDSRLHIGPESRLFLMIGVLGGYTTFSSFSLQTLTLMQDGEFLYASAYVLASVFVCLLAVWLGSIFGMMISQAR